MGACGSCSAKNYVLKQMTGGIHQFWSTGKVDERPQGASVLKKVRGRRSLVSCMFARFEAPSENKIDNARFM